MPKQLTFPTLEVTLWDESGEASETLIVRPAAFNNLSDVKELQKKLMEAFEEKNGSLGELLADRVVYADMKKLAALLRVVGEQKPGLDITSLYDAGDIVQLGQIFFSESVSVDMRSPGYSEREIEGQTMKLYNFPEHRQNPLPSGVSRIHDLAFFEMLIEIRENRATKQQETAATETEAETAAPEPLKVVATPA